MMGIDRLVALVAAVLMTLVACGGEGEPTDLLALEDFAVSEASLSEVTVSDVRPPRILAVNLDPGSPASGETVEAQVRVENPDSVDYRLKYYWKVAGRVIKSDSASITLPKLPAGSQISLEVTLSSDAGWSDERVTTAEVYNAAPRIYDLELSEGGDRGEELVVEAWANDPDGDPVEYRYTWFVNGRPSPVDGKTFPVGSLKRGDEIRVRVVAFDGGRESAPAESGTVGIANTSPDITSTPPRLGVSGVFRYQVTVDDPDGDRRLRYALVRGPRGMAIDPTSGKVTWKPEADQGGDNHVEIAVHDGHGGVGTQVFNVPIVVHRSDESAPPAGLP
jgi:hypothetical protein